MANVDSGGASSRESKNDKTEAPDAAGSSDEKFAALMAAANDFDEIAKICHPYITIGKLIDALDAIDLHSARVLFCRAVECREFAFALSGVPDDCKLDHIASLMERMPVGTFHDAELRSSFQKMKQADFYHPLDGSEVARRINVLLSPQDIDPHLCENEYIRSETPEHAHLLDVWIETVTKLIEELRAAEGEIDATLRARFQAAQSLAANPAKGIGRRVSLGLDTSNGKKFFKIHRTEAVGDGVGLLSDAWLASLRESFATWQKLECNDSWSSSIIPHAEQIEKIQVVPQGSLAAFLRKLRAAKPTSKWLNVAAEIASGLQGRVVRQAIIDWLHKLPVSGSAGVRERLWQPANEYLSFRDAVIRDTETYGSPASAAIVFFFDYGSLHGYFARGRSDPARLSETSDLLMRGAVWMLANWRDKETVDALQKAVECTLMRVCVDGRTKNYRSLIVANACINVLGEIATPDAVQALGRIKLKVRDERLNKQIAKAMDEAAKRAGVTVADLQEMAVPTFDLQDVGVQVVSLGEVTATLRVLTTTDVIIELTRGDGKLVKSLPAAVKADPESNAAFKQLKETAKSIAQALPVHRQRIESLYMTNRSWPLSVWRERYLDHPLIGALARRLIWNVTASDGSARSVIWHDGALVDAQGRQVKDLSDEHSVTLWHPLEAPTEDVAAWRSFLMQHRIVQPFKQAHRELYPLTDAERATDAYSNRFAGHILRQHQSVALARLRGWRVTLRINADVPNDQPTHLRIPDFGLAAELWTEKAGGDDAEYTDSLAYVFLSTDRVRFRQYTPADSSAEPGTLGDAVPLDQIPPRVFSEVMRDVDLFVGVASIGNDPAWNDGGADAEHPSQWRITTARDYWDRHSTAALEVAGENRRQFLSELLPSLKIGSVCTLDDRYLSVRGQLQRYRIHLGSGNILMDDDRYLCIVPKGNAGDGLDAHLPFEGDRMLSIILSKAVMLAADDKIKDASILSQLKRA